MVKQDIPTRLIDDYEDGVILAPLSSPRGARRRSSSASWRGKSYREMDEGSDFEEDDGGGGGGGRAKGRRSATTTTSTSTNTTTTTTSTTTTYYYRC